MESFPALINSGPATPDSCFRGLRMFKACSFGVLQRREFQKLCNPLRVHAVRYKAFPFPFIHGSHFFTPRLLRRWWIRERRRTFVTPCQVCAASRNSPTVYPVGHILHIADINKFRKLILWRALLKHLYWCLWFSCLHRASVVMKILLLLQRMHLII
jgi:hypothetical protein